MRFLEEGGFVKIVLAIESVERYTNSQEIHAVNDSSIVFLG